MAGCPEWHHDGGVAAASQQGPGGLAVGAVSVSLDPATCCSLDVDAEEGVALQGHGPACQGTAHYRDHGECPGVVHH